MPNFSKIISRHNKQSLNKDISSESLCKCESVAECPVDGKCGLKDVIYQATVKQLNTNTEDYYVGLTSSTFKSRYVQHNSNFRNPNTKDATTLSTHIWKLKSENIRHEVRWKIVTKAKSYSPSSGTCNLCKTEKYFIICKPHMANLNKRNELLSKCRHRNKFLLSNN